MELEQVVNLIVNNSVSIVVLAYFLFRDYKFMDTLKTTLTTLVKTVEALEREVDKEKEN